MELLTSAFATVDARAVAYESTAGKKSKCAPLARLPLFIIIPGGTLDRYLGIHPPFIFLIL